MKLKHCKVSGHLPQALATAPLRAVLGVGTALLLGMIPACQASQERDVLESVAERSGRFQDHHDVEDEAPPPSSKRRLTRREGDPRAGASALSETGLQIHLFDCGQADSMLVVGPGPDPKTLLVDLGEARGGDDENYVRVAERIFDITGESHLDYLLVSHFHSDHVGSRNTGIAGLLDWIEPQFTVGTFIDLGEIGGEYLPSERFTKNTLEASLERWIPDIVQQRVRPSFDRGLIDLGELEGKAVTVEILTFGGKAFEGDEGVFATVDGRYPGWYSRRPGSENDISIGLEIQYGEFEFFTAGDLTGWAPADWEVGSIPLPPLFTPRTYRDGGTETYTNVESHLAKVWQDGGREADVEIYRANHHGSRYSSCPDFLAMLDPEFVIYSSGRGNRYRHPDSSVLLRVATGARQLVTGGVARESWQVFRQVDGRILGDIAILVDKDGRSYSINGDPQTSYTDAEERAAADVKP